MAIYDDFYIINSNSYIKNIPTKLDKEFLKELKNDDGTLRDVRDVLFDVADGIENTTSSAERIRLAFKFFDSVNKSENFTV